MCSSPAAQPVLLTYDDYLTLPEDGRRYEVLEGELHATTAPSPRHQRVSRNLEFILHSYILPREAGEILDAPIDVILDRGTVVQPDILFVAATRLGIITKRGVEGPPDLVVEILSESTAALDRGAKRQLYARFGVAHYWLVDPEANSLAEFVLSQRDYALRGTYIAPNICTTALFPELAIALGDVFR